MSDVVIRVENLSKQYRLGTIGGNSLRAALSRWWAKRRGRPDPTLKIGETDHGNRNGEQIWALQDVSFEVKQGEVLGIIGRNGAGKSTLLKILSRVTSPTTGNVRVKGRIASLLEVGTGFHPELTGRENIYLNGAILGMRKDEIVRRFDEIVDFSGVEQFIDTPVKRYSSGMYVRLAFAVAAHLEPEILLVDEVLAVGDVAFQKKCLGKMSDVAREGRTVLFVSHNVGAVQTLCQRVIRIHKGLKQDDGPAVQVIGKYLNQQLDFVSIYDLKHRPDRKGNGRLRILSIKFESECGTNLCFAGSSVTIKMLYSWNSKPMLVASNIGFTIWTMNRQAVAECKTVYGTEPIILGHPEGYIVCEIPSLPLVPGQYLVDFCVKFSGEIYDWVENALILTVESSNYLGSSRLDSSIGAVMLLQQHWASSPVSTIS